MKKPALTLSLALCVLGAGAQQTPAVAPQLNISTNPSGVVYTSSFPVTVNIITGIQMVTHTLRSLTQFDVAVNGGSIVPGGQFKPFDNSDACGTMPLGLSCAASSSAQGSITAPLAVNEPGQYAVTVSTKLRDEMGTDQETVNVQLIAVEWPAPPAVANGMINSDSNLRTLTGKQRGCVISAIANKHAQQSGYGAKGGPYNNPLIYNDIFAFLAQCPR